MKILLFTIHDDFLAERSKQFTRGPRNFNHVSSWTLSGTRISPFEHADRDYSLDEYLSIDFVTWHF
jgi:hypothetical protein